MAHPYVLLAAAALFWSGNWIVGRALAPLVPPAGLTFWRWVIALALLAPFVAPTLWRSRALLARHWKPILTVGLLGGGLHNVLQYWGPHYTSAANGAILNSMTPIFIILMGAMLLGDPFPRGAAVGAAVGMAGALALVTRLEVEPLLTLVALVPVGLIHAGEIALGAHIELNATSALGLAYVAVFPALLAYHFWALGVAAVGAARAGVFLYLMPLFGAGLAILLLGETLGLHHAVGLVLIVAGVTIATRRWAG